LQGFQDVDLKATALVCPTCAMFARQRILKHVGWRMVAGAEREFFIDNLLVRIHFIIVMMRWTGLAPWEFKFPF